MASTSPLRIAIGWVRQELANCMNKGFAKERVDLTTRRALIATNPDFLEYLRRELDGGLADSLDIIHIPVPADLAAAGVAAAASREVG